MDGIDHRMTDVVATWSSLSGEPASFLHIPQDVFNIICTLVSVRDILALRMSNKSLARFTHDSGIWSFFVRKLRIILPLLPATSQYRFGQIGPKTYQWLMIRGLYLEQNWQRRNPVVCHSRFEAYDRTISIKMLPGGKYMVSVSRNLISGMYGLVLWDLDHNGRRVALIGATEDSMGIFKLEAKFGIFNSSPSIIIAYCTRSLPTAEGPLSKVSVLAVPVTVLEDIVLHDPPSLLFRHRTERTVQPFKVYHQFMTTCEIAQLALGDFDGEMVLVVVHRPHALFFHYLNSGRVGRLSLGPVPNAVDFGHSIWSVKLLTNQSSILIGRLLLAPEAKLYSTLFTLDMFDLPEPGQIIYDPLPLGRQFISGAQIDDFYFSDLETSWFESLRDPEGLMSAPNNEKPPHIAIFATTRYSRGVIQWVMRPQPVTGHVLQLPFNRGTVQRYNYSLPAIKVGRESWKRDQDMRPMLLPGAYRSIVAMRPHVHMTQQKANESGGHGVEIIRFCVYNTPMRTEPRLSTPRSRVNTKSGQYGEVEDEPDEAPVVRKRALRIPLVPRGINKAMLAGTTAMAWDESTGRMCVATVEDTGIHVLDFGGGGWELAVVEPCQP